MFLVGWSDENYIFLREKEERTAADRGSQAQQHTNFLVCIDLTVGIPTRRNP
jgi:hypothetical protein